MTSEETKPEAAAPEAAAPEAAEAEATPETVARAERVERAKVFAALNAIESMLLDMDLGGVVIVTGKYGSGQREVIPSWSGITSADNGGTRAYSMVVCAATEAEREQTINSGHFIQSVHERCEETGTRWGTVLELFNRGIQRAIDKAEAAAEAEHAAAPVAAAPAADGGNAENPGA